MKHPGKCRHCSEPIPPRKGLCLVCEQIVEREKARASGIVKRAVTAGELLPASACKCACCEKQAIGYGHHDYGRPLDVFPVCRSCNRIRKKPAHIGSTVVQYVAPPKREKEKPSGVVARTKIRKAQCPKCAKLVVVNGRICLECGTLLALKVAKPDFRKKQAQLVKLHQAQKLNQEARYAAYKRRAEESRQAFEPKESK